MRDVALPPLPFPLFFALQATSDSDAGETAEGDFSLPLIARLSEAESGRVMEVFGSQPSAQVYTANYLSAGETRPRRVGSAFMVLVRFLVLRSCCCAADTSCCGEKDSVRRDQSVPAKCARWFND